MQNIPTYELRINPENESFVEGIALVDCPAIEKDFMAFSKAESFKFSSDDEKMELIGPAMVPDMKIFRKDKDGKEYNVFFSKDTIRLIAQTYFKKGFQSNLNLDHSSVPAQSYIYQSYIVDSAKGISSPNKMNLPDGTWVIGVKVENKEIWDDIKSGKRNGFSVEGMFEFFSKAQSDKDQAAEEAEDLLRILNKMNSLIAKHKK